MLGPSSNSASKPLHERVQALLALGLTQTDLAVEMGCSQPHVCALAKPPPPEKKLRPSANVVDGLRRLETKYRRALKS